ncbi:hypothetical protein DRQ36_10600 [bacterium]|nr:MAG: hypothetical protein DRQ36_10600 [bacterium]
MRKSSLIIAFLFIMINALYSGQRVDVYFFYSKSCEHCQEIRENLLPPIKKEHSANLVIRELEIEDDINNYEKLISMEEEYGDEGNEIPVIFIGDRVIAGDEIEAEFLPYLEELLAEIEKGEELKPEPTETTEIAEKEPIGKPKRPSTKPEPKKIYPVFMAYFWEPGCQHCQRVTYDLQLLKNYHPTLIIKDWNIKKRDAKLLAEALSLRLMVPEELHMATPAIFLSDTAFVTDQISYRAIDEAITRLEKVPDADTVWKATAEELAEADRVIMSRFKGLHMIPVLAAGLLDGVNPCAFGAIIFFVTFLTVVERKRKEILMVGVAFTLAVFFTYFLIGAGFLKFLQTLPFIKTVARWVYIGTGVFAVALGLLSIFDFLRSRKGEFGDMVLQLPDKLKKRIHRVIIAENEPRARRNIVIAAVTTGFFVSILELACTGQVYLPTIIYVMGAPGLKTKAYFFLLLYNLMFIIPLVVVFAVVYYGTTSEQLTAFLKRNTPLVKLLTALMFFAMAYILWRTVLLG